jgi:hypothetical protein
MTFPSLITVTDAPGVRARVIPVSIIARPLSIATRSGSGACAIL